MDTYQKVETFKKNTRVSVYKVRDSSSANYLVIKKYKTNAFGITKHCLRELVALKSLSHPGIIKLVDVRLTNAEVNLIMEYGGETLRFFYKRIPKLHKIKLLPIVIRQLTQTLSYIHKAGVIHRDIKPDNILVKIDDFNNFNWTNPNKDAVSIKLCDFGLSRPNDKWASKQNGTLSYRAPEMYTGLANDKADIWSLGCVLYEFITGSILFPGKSDYKILTTMLSIIPCTKSDLQILKLTNINIDYCNNSNNYKIPLLYEANTLSPDDENLLNDFTKLLKQILVLNPRNRIGCMDIEDFISDLTSERRYELYNLFANSDTLPKHIEKVAEKMFSNYCKKIKEGNTMNARDCCKHLSAKYFNKHSIPAINDIINAEWNILKTIDASIFLIK